MKRLNAVRQNREVPHDEADSEGSWAISYGDMVTLLLCFFILFFTVDPERTRTESIQQALMNVLMNQMASPSRAPANSGAQSAAGQATTAAQAQSQGRDSKSKGEEKVVELDSKVSEAWGGKVHKMGSRIVIEFPGVTFFDSAKIKVTRAGEENLLKFTGMYMPYAGTNVLAVQAFTDLKPVMQVPGRKFSDNLELSALRSVATMRVLQRAGIPLSRMRVAGYGEMRVTARELASLKVDEARAYDLARKVVLVIQPEGRIEP